MLNEASIKRVLYYPEQLPDSNVPTIAIQSEASPVIFDSRQFPPLLVQMSEVAVDRDDDVQMRFKVDDTSFSPLAGSMFDLLANNFSLLARKALRYNLYNSNAGAAKADFKTFFSLWVIKPTVAHKLRLGIPLTPDEQKLDRDLGISDTVEKGLLPLPLKEQIEREFQVIQEEPHGFNLLVPTAGVDVETLHPLPGQFLVLTKISADPGTAAADNIRVAIDRDQVSDYIEFPTWALGATSAVSLGKEISCFIPALKELRIKLKATVQRTINIRFTVWKCALTNIFRARWGLVTPAEIPGDTWAKVMAGVL